MTHSNHCFHCGEPNPPQSNFRVIIKNDSQRMCCPGCMAVAQTIVDSGLTSYYDHRSETAGKATPLLPEELLQFEHYDIDQVQDDFVSDKNDISEIMLSVEGITCAACAWLIEKQLRSLKGMVSINVNTTLHRIVIKWNKKIIKLSEILTEIHKIGYSAYPFQIDKQEAFYADLAKSYLKRVGLAGLASMQIMMFAIALYGNFFSEMEAQFIHYFRWVSLIFATPVLLYSAQPFYVNAWRDLKNRSLGMDVPVSIALLGAYVASGYATIMEEGEVYFESISMFTFLLLVGRLLELRARRKASETSSNLLKLLPSMATLIENVSSEETSDETVEIQRVVPSKTLEKGQLRIVKAGESIPIDGIVLEGSSHVEESMLTGEHLPVNKDMNSRVYAGTVNISGPLRIKIEKLGNETLLAEIIQLQDTAQANKPQIQITADIISRYFIAGLLVIAALTYIGWHYVDPSQAFWIALSVLVATCPCALSLATPTALTCSTATLNKKGILIKQHHVLETVSKIDHMVFDKTGTLTQGNFILLKVHAYADYSVQTCINLASQLETHSEHPISLAFKKRQTKSLSLSEIKNHPGEGLSGQYKGHALKLGHAIFCKVKEQVSSKELVIYLILDGRLLAHFELGDQIRESAQKIIDFCQAKKIKTTLLSGDISQKSEEVSHMLGMGHFEKGMLPQGKLQYIHQLQKSDTVLMIGDGINDAPVLAGAHVSVALDSGTDIAKNSADVLLLGDELTKLVFLRQMAEKTSRIIKQNLSWALLYNLIIVPLAVMGEVPPYVAVIGMSFSSLIVVSNSLRLLK
ncbi:MAG: cadmium-translocating P-type ATPase [Thiotrichaceae bacterium]|nr:cadmium-translocating P-type ATPase [Thiotrichaceae bacterium]